MGINRNEKVHVPVSGTIRNAELEEIRKRFFHDVFEELYGVRLQDFGIKICLKSEVHLFSFDSKYSAFVVDIKFVRSPNVIKNVLKNKTAVLHSLVNKSNLQPHKSFSKLFDELFPQYKAELFGNMALAHTPSIGLMHFVKNDNKFDRPPEVIYTKIHLHRAVKSYVIPLRFVSTQVKPIESLSKMTAAYVATVNEALHRLGCSDFCIYSSPNGIILECDENVPYVICIEKDGVKKGNKQSKVYQEYMLFNKLAGV